MAPARRSTTIACSASAIARRIAKPDFDRRRACHWRQPAKQSNAPAAHTIGGTTNSNGTNPNANAFRGFGNPRRPGDGASTPRRAAEPRTGGQHKAAAAAQASEWVSTAGLPWAATR
ncbi:hypothetical protein GCM10022380_53330 [Amycolatopsis tucumanensis]|uniref:Uncharacterized protein n=1 Tax=Amycolatopsis tucumanensis TaxID=401106 RepID=A0ABP7IVX2_9PSEU